MRTIFYYDMYARHDVIIESACVWLEDVNSIQLKYTEICDLSVIGPDPLLWLHIKRHSHGACLLCMEKSRRLASNWPGAVSARMKEERGRMGTPRACRDASIARVIRWPPAGERLTDFCST